MEPMVYITDDPAEASVWNKLMKKTSSTPIESVNSLPFSMPQSPAQNLKSVNSQMSPGPDKSTLMQAGKGIQAPPPMPMQAPRGNPKRQQQTFDSMDALLDDNRVTPAINQAQGEVSDLKARIQQYLDQGQQPDFTALASLTDAWTGSKFAGAYNRPENSQERAKNVAALQNMVAQRQGDISKEELSLLKDKITAKAALLKADKDAAPFEKMLRERLDNSSHERVLRAVKEDKTIVGLFEKSRNIANAQSLLDQADVVPPEQFHEFQQTIRRNLGITGTSGLSEREKTMFNNVGLKWDEAQQFLYGTPQDTRESQAAFFKHLQNITGLIQKNNLSQMEGRLKAKMAGRESMYARRPDLYSDLQNLRSATLEQFSPEVLAPGSVKHSNNADLDSLSDAELEKLYNQGK